MKQAYRFTLQATALLIFTVGLLHARAPAWKPTRTVELVVGSAPGGSPDIMARVVQTIFQGKGLVPSSAVVNKPGAANTIGWAYLNQHASDAHYIATISPALIGNRLMGTSPLSYTHFTPLNIIAREFVVITVRGDSPIKTLADLTARMKKDPHSLSWAFATARGNHNHIVMSLYLKSIGVDPARVKTVIYPGGGPALSAMLGGHVDVYVASPRSMYTLHKDGRARILGISAHQRQTGPLAELATLKEQGSEAVFYTWRGFMGVKNLKPAEIAYWDTTFEKLATSAEWLKEAAQQFWDPAYMLSAAFTKQLEVEERQTRTILANLGLLAPGR